MKRLVPVLLAWSLAAATECQPARLELYEAYYNGPDTNNFSYGWRLLPPTSTSFDLSPYKPHLGCAIAYRFPVAVDSNGQSLPPECQPYNFFADGQSWGGM